MHPSHNPSQQSQQAQTQTEASPFDPRFAFDSGIVVTQGADIADVILRDPDSFYRLWKEMKGTIARMGGPDEAWRLFQKSPLGKMELPSHRSRRERMGEGAERVFYTSFDVEDLGALRQLDMAVDARLNGQSSSQPHGVSGLVGKFRDGVVQALVRLHVLVEMRGDY